MFFQGLVEYNDTNVDLSYLIRDLQLTREEAADKLESTLDISDDYIKYIVNKAGVDAYKFMQKLDKKHPKKIFKASEISN